MKYKSRCRLFRRHPISNNSHFERPLNNPKNIYLCDVIQYGNLQQFIASGYVNLTFLYFFVGFQRESPQQFHLRRIRQRCTGARHFQTAKDNLLAT